MRAVRLAVSFLALTLVVLGLGSTARATTMVYLPIGQLYDMSDVVVRGTVRSHTSFWGDGGELFTDWTVSVDEVLYGSEVEQVTVRQMGGELDGRRVYIPGDARLADGEHVVLFLVEEAGVHYLVALGQAKLEVSLQSDPAGPLSPSTERRPVGGAAGLDASHLDAIRATLVRDLSDIAFFAPEDGRFFHLENEIVTLDQLRALSPSEASPADQGGAP